MDSVTVPLASATTPAPRGDGFWTLLGELIGVMLRHPWLLGLTLLPNVIKPALEPIKAWLAQHVLMEITTGEQAYRAADLLAYAPIAVGIFAGLGLLTLWEKLTNRMLDDRLLIDLQRVWFDRRGLGDPGEQVARAINDCENARKPLDLFQKELWLAGIGLPAVLLWQVSLDASMLPALLVAALPPFAAALLFGGRIGLSSHKTLVALAAVGKAVSTGEREPMHREQERYYKHRVRFEWWKQCSEVTADFAGWLGLVLVLLLSVSGAWALIPTEVTAVQIGVFLVNLRLISKPLGEITKVYNKMREGWPAVRRVLRPMNETEGAV